MRFFVDANLPLKFALNLKNRGFDTIHTDDLPNRERTTDNEIRKISVEQDRIVITKDSDFVDSHLIQGIPNKLLIITTGNITNTHLLALIDKHFESVIRLFDMYDLIEINNSEIIGHDK